MQSILSWPAGCFFFGSPRHGEDADRLKGSSADVAIPIGFLLSQFISNQFLVAGHRRFLATYINNALIQAVTKYHTESPERDSVFKDFHPQSAHVSNSEGVEVISFLFGCMPYVKSRSGG
ncbi:hypothetical protein [Reichenbachiella sp.]|uniref:hypothetical protein n=1 Tax=Reichenbachiella sp. TaxID=2184521 RepID=UPI003B5B5C59